MSTSQTNFFLNPDFFNKTTGDPNIMGVKIGSIDARTTTSETIAQASMGKAVTLDDASPAAAIAVSLDSTVIDHFVCFVLNESTQTATLTPSSGDINDGTGAASNKTLAAGTSCALFKTSSGSPAVAHWKMLKGAGSGGGMSNPMTTVGDLIIGGTVTGGVAAPTRLAAPASGLVLAGNGTGVAPSYQSVASIALPTWVQKLDVAPPTSANAMDDEFLVDGTINTTLWNRTVNGQAAVTNTVKRSRLYITCVGPANYQISGWAQPVPGSTPWKFVIGPCKLNTRTGDSYGGPFICDNGSPTKAIMIRLHANANTLGVTDVVTWPDVTIVTGVSQVSAANTLWYLQPLWFRIYNNGTTIFWDVSMDGPDDDDFCPLYSAGSTAFLTATHIGLCGWSNNGTGIFSCDAFRRTL